MMAKGRGLGPLTMEGLRVSLNLWCGGPHLEPGMPGPADQSFLPFPLSVPSGEGPPSFSSFLLLGDQTPEEFPSTWDFWAKLDGGGHPISLHPS